MAQIDVVCVTSVTADKSNDVNALGDDLETRKLAYTDVAKACERYVLHG
jgi:hypothetical protein